MLQNAPIALPPGVVHRIVPGIQQFDEDLFRAIHLGWHSSVLDPIFFVISSLGLGWLQALLAISLIMWRKTRLYVFPLLTTLFVSGLLVTQGIKEFLVGRDRPSNLAFAVPQEDFFQGSFPSGHTTSSFALAFMLLFITVGTRRAWVGYSALVVAALIGLSRIYRGVHWPSDVLAGAFFGAASAAAVYLILDRTGHWLKLDQPEATLTGREVAEG